MHWLRSLVGGVNVTTFNPAALVEAAAASGAPHADVVRDESVALLDELSRFSPGNLADVASLPFSPGLLDSFDHWQAHPPIAVVQKGPALEDGSIPGILLFLKGSQNAGARTLEIGVELALLTPLEGLDGEAFFTTRFRLTRHLVRGADGQFSGGIFMAAETDGVLEAEQTPSTPPSSSHRPGLFLKGAPFLTWGRQGRLTSVHAGPNEGTLLAEIGKERTTTWLPFSDGIQAFLKGFQDEPFANIRAADELYDRGLVSLRTSRDAAQALALFSEAYERYRGLGLRERARSAAYQRGRILQALDTPDEALKAMQAAAAPEGIAETALWAAHRGIAKGPIGLARFFGGIVSKHPSCLPRLSEIAHEAVMGSLAYRWLLATESVPTTPSHLGPYGNEDLLAIAAALFWCAAKTGSVGDRDVALQAALADATLRNDHADLAALLINFPEFRQAFLEDLIRSVPSSRRARLHAALALFESSPDGSDQDQREAWIGVHEVMIHRILSPDEELHEHPSNIARRLLAHIRKHPEAIHALAAVGKHCLADLETDPPEPLVKVLLHVLKFPNRALFRKAILARWPQPEGPPIPLARVKLVRKLVPAPS